MEIDERLRQIETTQAKALVLLEGLSKKMDRVEQTVIGNGGTTGHNIRLDRLEQAAASAKRLFYALVVPVVLLCVKAVAGLLGTPDA